MQELLQTKARMLTEVIASKWSPGSCQKALLNRNKIAGVVLIFLPAPGTLYIRPREIIKASEEI